MADICIVGLLPAFSIGRIGCTVVSDHIGAAVDRAAWYAGLAMDYPIGAAEPIMALRNANPKLVVDGHILAWNLGLVEFLYLVPVNALLLFLAFRSSKRINAGTLVALTGALYAPVRFGLDFLRPDETDPRYVGLTFAQWASFLAFGAAVYLAVNVIRNGKPAEVLTKTSGEMQRKLKSILKDDTEPTSDEKKAPKA
jgi:prolipoprotein diacylglyceryltransferase